MDDKPGAPDDISKQDVYDAASWRYPFIMATVIVNFTCSIIEMMLNKINLKFSLSLLSVLFAMIYLAINCLGQFLNDGIPIYAYLLDWDIGDRTQSDYDPWENCIKFCVYWTVGLFGMSCLIIALHKIKSKLSKKPKVIDMDPSVVFE
jgi:hypothetical protein